MFSFLKFSTNLAHSPKIILMLAVMLFAGFFMTRLTKLLHLPHVTGYILAGVAIGPHILGLVDTDAMTLRWPLLLLVSASILRLLPCGKADTRSLPSLFGNLCRLQFWSLRPCTFCFTFPCPFLFF